MSAPDSEDVVADDQTVVPPRSLAAIFGEISDHLCATLDRLGQPQPRMAFGKKELPRLNSPPRIVGVPARGACRGAGNRHGSGVKAPWALWWRDVVIEFHVWDVDDTATEVLGNHLIAAIHDRCAGLYTPVGEDWGADADTKLGNDLIIGVRFTTLWSREFIPAVLPTTKTITGTIVPPTS